jgi:hypothetical protein
MPELRFPSVILVFPELFLGRIVSAWLRETLE